MATARDSDFLGEGTADQGTARPLSLVEQARFEEDARRRRLEESKAARMPYQNNYRDIRRAADARGQLLSNQSVTADRIARTGSAKGNQQGIFGNLADDPVTTGVLLAPYGVVGAGLAVGGPQALGFGLGEGTIAGGSPAYAFKDTVAPTLARTPSTMPGGIGTPGAAARTAAAGAPGASAAAPAAASAWTTKDTVQTLAPLATWGASTLGESLIRSGGDDERKALAAKQEQIARETQLRRQQQQQARMDTLANRMLAFDPYNQHLAQMFGPGAAFQPEQLAALTENTMKPELDPALRNYRGTDDKKEAQINDYMAAMDKYKAAEEARRNKVMGGIQRPGPGPAPIQPRTPLAAKRY